MSERNWKIVNTKWTDSRSAEFAWDENVPDGIYVRVEAEMDDGRRFAHIQFFTREAWEGMGRDRCEEIARDSARPPEES